MNRISKKFKELRRKKQKAFISFVTAGDPNLKTTEELVLAFEKNSVDIVELGVPFSDPLADGPTIQASSQRALDKGVNLEKILQSACRIRQKSSIPLALMTYYNPVFHFGEEKFIRAAKAAGVDGLIIPDLPPEEAANLIKLAKKADLATVFFVAPTTRAERIKKIAKVSTGFIYYVSLTGVTGARQGVPQDISKHVRLTRRLSKIPVCIGFGVSTPEQVKTMSKISDGVIVGSAIVKKILEHKGKKTLVANVASFARRLSKGVRS